MARILVTGIVTLDHTLDVAEYPPEDAEIRALASSSQPGGNAANTATLLTQAGHRVELAAVVAQGPEGDGLLRALQQRGVYTDACVRRRGHTPTSHILRSRATGSRTIVHYRDLPEFEAADFRRLELSGYDWFHFEGRNPVELPAMLRAARAAATDQPLSLELEKPRDGLAAALPLADVLMFSRGWVTGGEPERFIAEAARERPDAVQTLTWGRRGAWLAHRSEVTRCPASPGVVVRDSVGAGDSFNAGLIHALVSGQPPERALADAVQLAERKLAQAGLDGLFGGVEPGAPSD
ncbi:Ketohexokinase [Thioalkalivibrio nitratireducens DSM 14787]|uniref:Ketohexokinase n=1 Tax=Thioalkalivibrio nitratireducens (strain DSM 14787 / UNIQEM 213 / ALEN2) TaxID=1255043 RepID=L0E1B8_THIND|nr:PfkB family carbohydrate kinase [Thioalkalivibrio nitratireducens]AGA35098.1 Ketohexokinase [Thioalkalivibrio nitratireducens DSM 14787]